MVIPKNIKLNDFTKSVCSFKKFMALILPCRNDELFQVDLTFEHGVPMMFH